MSQTREDRMYLMWQAAKKSGGYEYYRKGWISSPLMQVARRFKIPVREVREIIEAKKGSTQ